MAVANAWATGHSAVSLPQLRPSSSDPPIIIRRRNSHSICQYISSQKNKFSKLSCRCSNNIENSDNHDNSGGDTLSLNYSSTCSSSSSSSADWDWNTWTRYFSEIEQAENYSSILKFQLEDAIEKEDFQEAAKLKIAIEEATSKTDAIDEERYHDASRLCRSTGSGLCERKMWKLVGGLAIQRIQMILWEVNSDYSRNWQIYWQSYSPRQLVTSSPGTPLFEIFVLKMSMGHIHAENISPQRCFLHHTSLQVVFLKQIKANSANSSSSSDQSTKTPSAGEIENASVVDVKLEENEAEKGETKSIDLEGAAEEGIKSYIEEDNESDEEEGSDVDDNGPDQIAARGDSDNIEDENNLDMKLYIGGCPRFSELMPPDVAKAFWSSEKVSPKVSRDVREIVKLAVSQAQKRNRLSEYTNFSRITTSKGDLDPFDVLEYVEAVKLTGDLNVPAGQVTFRAKIGKVNRLANRGMYPLELGVVASFKGQGRIAEFGFKNPRWVEGELLQLNGKGLGPYVKGADLGFLYVVPEQSFLVLFNRLKLPE
ncbi:hypothetical protein BUALT_Bualt07G0034700 [Buddleja alternifolia]|uniref:Uncharacterized protein n=1 Tax=Buddleja alternifolia TaxID=168488 RepID=A0AAV6XFL7_9LAMI|nr:hypothetical protein BUALT_Bualt07G0034700 [Buddleja alternifolia]